jgi:hypothetical protein
VYEKITGLDITLVAVENNGAMHKRTGSLYERGGTGVYWNMWSEAKDVDLTGFSQSKKRVCPKYKRDYASKR